ncbi:MAG: hypothetical protein KatS3mg028_0473 [Bacteroidia bacterium]|nr:MAG: hypothetical protein KatS3mg028_0473 [Bacteroidia bacterium]
MRRNRLKCKRLNQGKDYENFFIGNNPERWASNVKNYQHVILKNIYENIDYEAITSINGMKYNFIVHKQARPKDIQIAYQGGR